MQIKTNPKVKAKYDSYPKDVKVKLTALRKLIIETANELEEISILEETLKWGEPSYLTKKGSTLRIDWKEKTPNQYAMYFNCSSRLVSAFRLVFTDIFEFEGNRAIVFKMKGELPKTELKACIAATLQYHKVKHLPTLGL